MLWFQPLPWARWSLVVALAAAAVWFELRPTPTVEVPFAIVAINPGEILDDSNVEFVSLPEGVMEGATEGSRATRNVLPGEPVLESHVGDAFRAVPAGWWVVPVALPNGAQVGSLVRLILLDSGAEVEGVIANPGADDPFAAADGGVAVPADAASATAIAASDGRLAVLISSG